MKLQIAVKFLVIGFALVFSSVKADGQNVIKYIPPLNLELTDTIITHDGDVIIRARVPGIPPKPGVVKKNATMLPASSVVINDVPAFLWSFGCTPTVGAMMAGYYDRNGYPDMYTGPTNNGVCPLDNASWGAVWINGENRYLCPLSATRQGLDGRTERGHVDDYWIKYENNEPDPYIVNGWVQHEYADCTADFMKTSQNEFGNIDGSTSYYFYPDGGQFNLEYDDDGPYGLKLFFESRNYNVDHWFTQTIIGYNGNKNGFSFNDYKIEIDEGRPVMIHLNGHSVLGIGYDTDTKTIHFHDTWDYEVHSMVWGGVYNSPPNVLQMFGVGVFELEPNIVCMVPENTEVQQVAGTSAELTWDFVSVNDDFELIYGKSGFDLTAGTVISVQDTNGVLLQNLTPDTQYTCYVRMVCGDNYSNWGDSISFRTFNMQQILLTTGWNIMSTNLLPVNPNMESVFQSLISNGSLIKIQDENGNSLENLGIYGEWKNNIGDIELTEGYKVKVSGDDSIQVYGPTMVGYPYAIPLKTGWNIIGYPQIKTFDGLDVMQELIARNSLIKVQDKAGNSIEDLGVYGGWKNTIGDFEAGEGYKIKVSGDDTLWISDSYPKSASLQPALDMATHFIPAYKGNGTDHMNIHLVNLTESGIIEGDEIGVFDGNICVGSAKVNIQGSTFKVQHSVVNIPVSAADGNSIKNGYTAGNTVTVKLYRNGDEHPLAIEPLNKRKPTFEIGGSLFVQLNLTTEIKRLPIQEGTGIKCYPNPFNDEITIEINLVIESEVEAKVLNQSGQQVKIVTSKRLFPKGMHNFVWNGKNMNNQPVTPGIYHLRMKINDDVFLQKIVLLN
ncbi:hypothetical protein MASR2M47_45900 [Draconibacterium sp.]